MSRLKIALLQMRSHQFDQQANLQKGEDFCRRAKALGADIALFPEMWNIGYTPYSEQVNQAGYNPLELSAEEQRLQAEWQARAVSAEDGYVQHFCRLAAELEMAIAVTYLERWSGAPRNSVTLIDRHGTLQFTYAKVHTCDFSMEAALTPGEAFYVCPLDTAQGVVNIGAMICYDREFPESARVLMLQGAEIILVPNACELEMHRLGQFRVRAMENMLGMAMTNYPAPEANGHSMAVHPIAFDQQGRSRDLLILEAGEDECLHVAEFDLDALRDYRQREAWGNAYRKPRAYGLLTSPQVEEPFIRQDAKR